MKKFLFYFIFILISKILISTFSLNIKVNSDNPDEPRKGIWLAVYHTLLHGWVFFEIKLLL